MNSSTEDLVAGTVSATQPPDAGGGGPHRATFAPSSTQLRPAHEGGAPVRTPLAAVTPDSCPRLRSPVGHRLRGTRGLRQCRRLQPPTSSWQHQRICVAVVAPPALPDTQSVVEHERSDDCVEQPHQSHDITRSDAPEQCVDGSNVDQAHADDHERPNPVHIEPGRSRAVGVLRAGRGTQRHEHRAGR